VLQSELYWYRALVEAAVTLNATDRQATVQATMTRCGWDSWGAWSWNARRLCEKS
jgi:hypothetical protein